MKQQDHLDVKTTNNPASVGLLTGNEQSRTQLSVILQKPARLLIERAFISSVY
jgi:hypothetical protein